MGNAAHIIRLFADDAVNGLSVSLHERHNITNIPSQKQVEAENLIKQNKN